MNKQATSVATSDTNIVIQVDKIQMASLDSQGQGNSGKEPKLPRCTDNITFDAS